MVRKNRKPGQPGPLTDLFKPGIIFLVVITGAAGYGLSYQVEHQFNFVHFLLFIFGLAMISAGSFALNQVQEWKIDVKMPRTQLRPIPTGKITPRRAALYGFLVGILGLSALAAVSPLSAGLGFLTAVLYNVFYTLIWKRKWSFGAVPGAIPGAMPAVIGYAANTNNIFSPECIYMFLVMFIWQMPHFWSLAIKFKEDYRQGGIPVLPSALGVDRTLYHIGLYIFAYVALAVASPWFVDAGYFYLILVVPFAIKVLWEYLKYMRCKGEKGWFPFFMWVNLSVIAFLMAPVLEKWFIFFTSV